MTKYKIGTKVRVVECLFPFTTPHHNGQIGEFVEFNNNGNYEVQLKKGYCVASKVELVKKVVRKKKLHLPDTTKLQSKKSKNKVRKNWGFWLGVIVGLLLGVAFWG
jgi:hypothetical protein